MKQQVDDGLLLYRYKQRAVGEGREGGVDRLGRQFRIRDDIRVRLTLSLNLGIDAKSKPHGRRKV